MATRKGRVVIMRKMTIPQVLAAFSKIPGGELEKAVSKVREKIESTEGGNIGANTQLAVQLLFVIENELAAGLSCAELIRRICDVPEYTAAPSALSEDRAAKMVGLIRDKRQVRRGPQKRLLDNHRSAIIALWRAGGSPADIHFWLAARVPKTPSTTTIRNYIKEMDLEEEK